MIPAPHGSVIVWYSIEDGVPSVTTNPCIGIAVITKHVACKSTNGFDRLGDKTDYQELKAMAMIDELANDEADPSMRLFVTPLTRYAEISEHVQARDSIPNEMYAATMSSIVNALGAIGIFPQ
jgi:hypothetical protein